MTKPKRTLLFVICLILFIILAPAVIMYSAGYRLDLKEKKITQTGGLYFRIQPKSATVEIADLPKKKTDLLFGTALIDNIFPKSYRITVGKGGYIAWTKSLSVEPKKVAEAKNITLVPVSVSAVKLDTNSARLFKSPKGNRLILEKYLNGLQYFAFIGHINGQEEMVLGSEIFNTRQVYIHKLTFSNDERLALVKAIITADLAPQRYYLLDYRSSNGVSVVPAVKPVINIPISAQNVEFNGASDSQLLFIDKGTLWKIALDEPPGKLTDGILAFKFVGNDLYYFDSRGFIYKSDGSLSFSDRINSEPFNIQKDREYNIVVYGGSPMIKEDDSLYRLASDKRQFEKLFERISEIRLSPDNKKAVILAGSEIWVYYLTDEADAPRRKSGDLVFLTRLSGQIQSVYWYTSHYLIFAAGGAVKITEIDDRDAINLAEPAFHEENGNQLIIQKNIDIVYNEQTQRLYLLTDNAFYLTEKMVH